MATQITPHLVAMSRRYFAVLAFTVACRSADRTAGAAAVGGSAPRPDECTIAPSLSRDSAAVRCAEEFVARNGYGTRNALDTARIAHEFIEVGSTMAEVLASRRNSLDPTAVVLCRERRGGPGFTVAFVPPSDSTLRVGRAVTMDPMLHEVRMEHQDYLPATAASMPGCARLRRRVQSR